MAISQSMVSWLVFFFCIYSCFILFFFSFIYSLFLYLLFILFLFSFIYSLIYFSWALVPPVPILFSSGSFVFSPGLWFLQCPGSDLFA
jgi:hypothetical protein